MLFKKIVFPAPVVQQLFDINFHDTVSFLSANSPNVLFPAGGKCLCPGTDHTSCPRARSPTVLPRLSKDIKPCGAWHLLRMEGGYVHSGEGSVFFKGKALYCVAGEGKEDME